MSELISASEVLRSRPLTVETGQYPYFFASPSNLPVFRLMKCILVQAGQTIPSYSFSEISGLSSNWCWTLRLVAGHLKTKWAIGQNMTALRTRS
jgi:hypothetical protein